MLSCGRCAAEIPEASRFCLACGAPIGIAPDGHTRTREAPLPASLRSSPAKSEHFAPGALLAGRFRIVSLLGRGGMGEVYRAEDLKLGQAVALKFLPDPIDQRRLARFYAEVRLGRQVAHPNVCRIYDVIESDGRHFLVMEYVDGEDLASLLRRIGRLPQDKGLEIARGLCAGLAAAHEKAILHRDLKPANVMIDGRGQARIMDFGLAVLAGETEQDARAGTPAYMAPEQLKGEELSVRTDLYSLGLVLYEVFTGRRAWDAGSMSELVKARSESGPATPTSLVPELDRVVERAIMSCLAPEPSARPSTALAVQAALPGGDPLQAAIALGETPSPEMVVAASIVGDLSARAAWAYLGTALLALACILMLSEHVMLHRLVPLPRSPDVLLDRAKTLAARLAPGETIADRAWGFDADKDYLREMAERDPRGDWKGLAVERPGPLLFWYRASRESLVARTWTPLPAWIPGARLVGHVTRQQPPLIGPGMQEVVLDPSGRLVRWQRVPARGDPRDKDVQATLGLLFAEAGLEGTKLIREPNTLDSAEDTPAWSGRFPDAPGVARVVASIRDTRVCQFEVTRGDRRRAPVTFGSVFSGMTLEITLRVSLLGGIPVGVAIVALAVWNLRSQRADRRGGLRIALFGAVSAIVAQKLWLHYPSSLADFVDLWFVSDGQPIQWAAIGWLYYSALEPELRRTWPHLLVSWSRLLKGRWRDPLVGRHVLLGLTAGLIWACLWLAGGLIPEPRPGATSTPLELAVPALASSRDALAIVLIFLYPAVLLAIGWLITLLIFFRVTRSRAAAILFLWVVFFLVLWNFLEGPFGATIMAAVVASLVVAVVFRLGLLSSAIMVYVCYMQVYLPPAGDLSAWYAGTSAMGLASVVGLAVYGFLVSLAGKPLFGRPVLEG